MTELGSITPPNPLSYEGQVSVPFIIRTFPPQPSFNKFPVPTIWVNKLDGTVYLLSRKPLGEADWIFLGSPNGSIDEIVTPDSSTVIPVDGQVNFLNGSGINITGIGNNVTFNALPRFLEWVNVTTASQPVERNTGYFIENPGLTTLTLPTNCDFGSVFCIAGFGAGGWILQQNAGQTIYFGEVQTSIGLSGGLASTHQRDCITVVCTVANTTFEVIGSIGNIEYT